MRKFIEVIILIIVVSIFSSSSVFAAKKFIPKKTTKFATGVSIPATVSYRPDRLGLNLSFRNFNGLESVTYSFTYNTNGIAQGIGGTVTSGNNPTANRELLFGTCSRGACRYHSNLSGARLVLTAKLSNGKIITKSYRIKTYR